MPISNYMPDVQVHIAFNAGFLTPSASRTWTDVSQYVDLDSRITIKVARNDEQSKAEGNTCVLTLDNSDGRFTPERSSSPYYPNVILDRPIRVQYKTTEGVVTYERFNGYITEWPVSWEDTDGRAMVTITASSRLARFASMDSLRSIVEEIHLLSRPSAYYPLGEPAGSTQANDASGNGAPAMTIMGDPSLPLVFGQATGPGTDDLTAVQFTGGQFLETNFQGLSVANGITAECFVLRSGAPAAESAFLWLGNGMTLSFLTTGQIKAYWAPAGTVTSPLSYADGNTHHVAMTITAAGSRTLYVDGVSVATASGALPSNVNTARLGGLGALGGVSNPNFVGVIAHFAVSLSAVSATDVANHSQSGKDGFVGDTTSARATRYAQFAGIPTADLVFDAGQITVQHVDSTGKQPLELIRMMEDTEGGYLYDSPDGFTTFRGRSARFGVISPAFTVDMAAGMGENDYSPRLDRSTLINRATVEDVSGKYKAVLNDTTSQTNNGVASESVTTAAQDDDEPLFMASWLIYKYKTPISRVPSLTLKVLDQVGKTDNSAVIASTPVGSLISITNRPSADSTSSASFFIEGWNEVIGPESVDITYNLSPANPDQQTLVIGNVTRGVIGTNPVAL